MRDEKYSDRGVPDMVLAQRDFIKKEKEYFGDECIKWNFIIIISFWISFVAYATYKVINGV